MASYNFTKKELEESIKRFGSLRKTALGLGISRDTLKNHCVKHGIEPLKLKRPSTRVLHSFQHATDQELIDQLQIKGYFITKDPQKQDYSFKGNLEPFEGDMYKIAVCGDTHLCSRYQQISHLHTFYDRCEKEGITDVYNTGDILDGNGRVYRGQEYELFVHGADSQINYAVKNYPERKGMTTHFICGNHDESHYKTSGLDIGKTIARRRKDMNYYGFYGAKIDINGVKNMIYLNHGAGGGAYARSYNLQKFIEQMAPDAKPYMLFQGHYHTMCWLPMYRNVSAWKTPCFQSQTPYLKRKGLYPELGGLIVEFKIHKKKPTVPRVELIPFYVPKKDDY